MATIKDVAREAGLTVTTVSRVLNNRGYISEKTRRKVEEVMKELNYQPSEVARSLSKQSTSTIGVIVPHIVHPYFSKMISHIEKTVSKYNYKMLLYNSGGDKNREKRYLELCQGSRVSGVIIFSYEVQAKQLLENGIPVVTVEKYIENATASVVCDNFKGGALAAGKLIEAGCKNLIMFGSIKRQNMPANYREDGFKSECEKNKVKYKVFRTDVDEYMGMEHYEYIKKILVKCDSVDGIFASSDVIAAQIIQVCKHLNKDIPRDIKLIGFDDVLISSLTTPSISTIHQPAKEMAGLAVEYIIKASKGEVVPDKTVLPVEFIERESTKLEVKNE